MRVNTQIKIDKNSSSVLSNCIAAYYLMRSLRTILMYGANNVLVNVQRLITIVMWIIVAVILYMLISIKRKTQILFITEILVLIAFALSYSLGYADKRELLSDYKDFAIYYVPLFLSVIYIDDYMYLVRKLYKMSLLIFSLYIYISLTSYSSWGSDYNMALGYSIVFCVLLFATNYVNKRKIQDFILAIIGGLFALFIGSRGLIICIIAFIILLLVISNNLTFKQRLGFISFFIVTAIIVYNNFSAILSKIILLSTKLGFKSRSLRLLAEGAFVNHESGRGRIYRTYIELIEKKPWFGYGLMGCWNRVGFFPHNIILELFVSFGIPIGTIFFIIILFLFIRAVRSNNDNCRTIALIFSSFSACLFVSSSFLLLWQFYIGLALGVSELRQKRRYNRREKHEFSG